MTSKSYNERYQNWSGYEKSKYYQWREPMHPCMNDLMDAIDDSDHEQVAQLIHMNEDNIQWMTRDSQWHSMVNMAVKRDDLEMVRLLLDNGALIEWSGSENFDKQRPLSYAIYLGHNEIADLLLDYGADPNGDGPKYSNDPQQGWGGSPVTMAYLKRNVPLLNRLREAGAEEDIHDGNLNKVSVIQNPHESWAEAYIRTRDELRDDDSSLLDDEQ